MNEKTDTTFAPPQPEALPQATPLATPEERIRAAKTPEEVALALIGLVGDGLGFNQILGAVVDGKIDDSSLPEGTSREQVKAGFSHLLGGFAKLFPQ